MAGSGATARGPAATAAARVDVVLWAPSEGPLALLDDAGLDVAVAIGETIGADVPERLRALVAEGAPGRRSGRGLHSYEP